MSMAVGWNCTNSGSAIMRAGQGGQRQALAAHGGRVGGDGVEAAEAAGGQHGGGGAGSRRAAPSSSTSAPRTRPSPSQEQGAGLGVLADLDVTALARTAAITAAMIAAPAPSPPTRATRAREWAASRLWTKRAVGAAVEGRAEFGQAPHGVRALAGEDVDGAPDRTRPAPAATVSAACRAGSSSSAERRGHAALGPGRGAALRRAARR